MAVSVNADAQIIHSGSVDTLVDMSNPMVWLDLDNDGTDDFGFSVSTYKYKTISSYSTTTTSGYTTVTITNTMFTNFYLNNSFKSGSAMLLRQSSELMPKSMTTASMISSGQGFSQFNRMGSYAFYSTNGNIFNKDSALIGLTFKISGNIHYGWMRVHLQDSPFQMTVYDYAYHSEPGYPIYAGHINYPPEVSLSTPPYIPEDTVYALTPVDLGYSDADMDPVYIILQQLPRGDLFRDGNMNYTMDAGEGYQAGDTIPDTDVGGNYVLYMPVADHQGFMADSISYKVTDYKDDNDSVYTQYIDINTANDMYGSITSAPISCSGQADGQATAEVKDGVPPYGFTWSTGATTDAISGLAAGIYTCTVSDNYPSTDVVSVTITEPSLLSVAPATINDATCGPDGSITPAATGGTVPYSYTWNTGGITTGQLTGIAAGTYSYTVTDDMGCTASSASLTVNGNTVDAQAGADQSVCAGDKVTLEASGGSSYAWSGNITQGTAFAPKQTSTYTVTVTDNNDCQATDQLTVTVNPLPTVSVDNPVKLICAGDEVRLNASGASTYVWSNGQNNGTTVSPSLTASYSVTGTDANGCSNTAALTVYMKENCDGTTTDASGVIAGALTYSQGTMASQSALVKLFEKEYYGTSYSFTKVKSDTVGVNGSFYFGSLPEGVYVLKAEVLDKTTYPQLTNTYYDGLHNWFNADTIMNNGGNIRTVSMKMHEISKEQSGSGRFIGGVYRLSISKDGTATGEPVPGAEIYLEQEPDGDPVGYTISSDDGGYEFRNINQASSDSSYSLYINIDGASEISSYEGMVISETDTLYENLDVIVDTITQVVGKASDVEAYADSVTSVNLYNSPGLNIKLYPVPSDGPVYAEYSIENAALVSINLMDAMGNDIGELYRGQLEAGTYRQQINEGLTAGVYYLRFRIGSTVLVKKILIVN